MRINLTIGAKLIVAYVLFLAPIGYLGYEIVVYQQANIGFAAKEIQGVRYISTVQEVLDRLARGGNMPGLGDRIKSNQAALGSDLKTAEAAAKLVDALAGTDQPAAAQAAADLISKAADGSNLTLDPDLDSFYTQDILTVKIPSAVADVAALVSAVSSTAGHDPSVADQVNVGLQTGALQSVLDGMAADIDSAVRGNPDGTVNTNVAARIGQAGTLAKASLAALSNHAAAADAGTIAKPLLDALTQATVVDAVEVEHLLNARIGGFRSTEITDGAIAFVLFGIAVGYVLIVVQRGVIGPLRILTMTMRRLADQDLSIEVRNTGRNDEIGAMSQAVLVFKGQMIERRRLDAAAATVQNARERQQLAMKRHTQDFGEVVTGVLGSLSGSATSMHNTAHAMARIVEQTHAGTTAAAAGAQANAVGLSRVAAATEELTASIGEIARQVGQASAIARQSVEQSNATGHTVHSLIDAVGQIGNVVRLISDIASQTNLLALNATIEAARAGDAGKGFAVVASEVKQLATQTSKATEEIRLQIEAIASAVNQAVGAVTTVGAMITSMDDVTTAIAASVEQQGAATREIAISVQSVSHQNESGSQAMTDVSRMAEDAKQSSDAVIAVGNEIGRVAQSLRDEVANFFQALRDDTGERRRLERRPGHRMPVTLKLRNGHTETGELEDISHGGAAISCAMIVDTGTEIDISIGSASVALPARVLRTADRRVSVGFRQDPVTQRHIDEALLLLDAADQQTDQGTRAAA